MMDLSLQALEQQLPYYLTQDQKLGLAKELSEFRKRPIRYFIDQYKHEMLQGDGWSGLPLIHFSSGSRKSVRGIVLSNSCDIAPDNKRELPVNLVFAPLIKLDNYRRLLEQKGLSNCQVNDKLLAIRNQDVTSIFYLPIEASLDAEYIALLDDVHSAPSREILASEDANKIFTLSLAGFYLFILKLSIHFCRFHENAAR